MKLNLVSLSDLATDPVTGAEHGRASLPDVRGEGAIVGDHTPQLDRIDGRRLFPDRPVVVAFKRQTKTYMFPGA